MDFLHQSVLSQETREAPNAADERIYRSKTNDSMMTNSESV